MNRELEIESLKTEQYDVCVIGAGASGAGVALDAALRGLKVCLIDRGDFVSETSAKSTKLIHGGVRYLEQAFKNLDLGQLKQVRHGLAERKYLLSNGAHVSNPLGIITPVFSAWEAFYYTVGLKLYGLFASKDHLPAARWLSKKETLLLCPNINPKIHSAVMYFDGQLDDARFALSLVMTALQKGGNVANYVKIKDFEKNTDGKLVAANAIDLIQNENFKIKSKIFINCTGPFADELRIKANNTEEPRITPAKGVHIVIPKRFFDSQRAMLIPKTKDGRLIFMIPFKSVVMVGTTDTPYNTIDIEPKLEKEEIGFLIETVTEYLKEVPKVEDIISGFGGLRPLITAKSRNPNDTKTLLRDHEVEHDAESGLISLLGGKWTTYRLMAQDTIDYVMDILNIKEECKTHEQKLIGSQGSIIEKPIEMELEIYEHLKATYGDQSNEIIKLAIQKNGLSDRIHEEHPYLKVEVEYGVDHEMIEKPRDYFARRTRWELMNWQHVRESIEIVSAIIAEKKNWTQKRLEKEIAEYNAQIIEFQNVLN